MVTRNALRSVSRRLSSSGKVVNIYLNVFINEEEKAAKNVFIKEKLEKIARKGPGEQAGTAGEAKASGASSTESGPKVSEDKQTITTSNGVGEAVILVGAIVWYMKSRGKKFEDQYRER